MGQVMSTTVIVLLIIFVFVPLAVLNANNAEIQDIKQSLNLSARVLNNVIEKEKLNYENLAGGYENQGTTAVKIDKVRLLREFYDILYKNYPYSNKFETIKSRLLIKVLVYEDMFFLADNLDNWSAPYFFTRHDDAYGEIYLNLGSDSVYYYNGSQKVHMPLEELGIGREEKNDIIIARINEKIAQYTYAAGEREGLEIQIRNPDKEDFQYKLKNQHFNVLEGITFFVVYTEDTIINVNSKEFRYKNYNVTGYTLNFGDLQ